MVGLKWINAKLPGIYDIFELEKTLFTFLERDLKTFKNIEGRGKMMREALMKSL